MSVNQYLASAHGNMMAPKLYHILFSSQAFAQALEQNLSVADVGAVMSEQIELSF